MSNFFVRNIHFDILFWNNWGLLERCNLCGSLVQLLLMLTPHVLSGRKKVWMAHLMQNRCCPLHWHTKVTTLEWRRDFSRQLNSSEFLPEKQLFSPLWKVVAEPQKMPGFLASRGEEFNLGPVMRLDHSELLCNTVLLKYERDRESF